MGIFADSCCLQKLPVMPGSAWKGAAFPLQCNSTKIWLQWQQSISAESSAVPKSIKDLSLSLPVRVLWNKVFLLLEPREGKGEYIFQRMALFTEVPGAATRCLCYLQSLSERGMRSVLRARLGAGLQIS